MKKLKYLIFSLVVLGGLFFLLGPEAIPDNFQPQEILETAKNSDVIIIFKSGGWGNTPFEKAEDFGPIVKEIQKTLNGWGYNSIVISYNRTKDNFSGKMAGAKDFLNSFESSSNLLAEEIEFLVEKLPDKKVIMTGLSAGGAFVTKTYEKVSEEARSSILTITAGTPFWVKSPDSENILQLNNVGKDSLAKGEIKTLFLSLFESPLKWVSAKISGRNLSLSRISNQFIGHTYDWNTAAPEITLFLEIKFLHHKDF